MTLDKVERRAEDDRRRVRAILALFTDKLGLLVRTEGEADAVQRGVGRGVREVGERAPEVVGDFAVVELWGGDRGAGAAPRVDDDGTPAESALLDRARNDGEDIADVGLVRASGQATANVGRVSARATSFVRFIRATYWDTTRSGVSSKSVSLFGLADGVTSMAIVPPSGTRMSWRSYWMGS